jgi:predicted nucleic acid-binding protein
LTTVVDANIVGCWFLKEPEANLANRFLREITSLTAPDLLIMECASVFAQKTRVGAITRDDAALFLRELRRFVPEIVNSGDLVPAAMALAMEYDHTVYDCVYLSLAMRLHTTVVTLDRRFQQRFSATPHARHILHLSDWSPP